jgi:GntR family transcriptional regulator
VAHANNKRFQALRPNGDDPTPLYLQVARRLADAINAGEWRAEQALPPERELSGKLGVSRVTARKALDVLVDQRLIVRRQGSGTFIATHIEEPLSRLTNFTELLKRKGFESTSRWVERKVDAPTYEEVLKLGVSPGSQVARLERLRLADGVVMALERSTLPIAFLPDPRAVESSLYAYLDARGQGVARALQHFRAVNATKKMAQFLGIKAGDAILLVTRVGFTKDNVAIELTDTFCRNDYYDFVAELHR